MPASEIDDIFASRGKVNIVSKPPPVLSSLPEKKKKKKNKASSNTPVGEAPSSNKRSAPETVMDPSVQSVSKKRQKSVGSSNPTQPSSKDEFKRFKDSKGSGSRRKTEEGYHIYDEDELGISARGGDTPLCPFDCKCCF
ncbi:hypothetical protein PAXRUDRAFT_830679 [Paxillus rubicundulus Ve08.2h10]|uniref:DUF1764-domain-containing protein n=1 Tax=Paxillus rubicundulus Ve08.2h10 TaxID=930991 RepID=A0A0D0E3H3_9AGAM|nr:hypothetical protein PAXRUDRAFT_830679 [Paxillus rubicundulus Ve08.2h10]